MRCARACNRPSHQVRWGKPPWCLSLPVAGPETLNARKLSNLETSTESARNRHEISNGSVTCQQRKKNRNNLNSVPLAGGLVCFGSNNWLSEQAGGARHVGSGAGGYFSSGAAEGRGLQVAASWHSAKVAPEPGGSSALSKAYLATRAREFVLQLLPCMHPRLTLRCQGSWGEWASRSAAEPQHTRRLN